MYARSKKSLILSVASLLISTCTIWSSAHLTAALPGFFSFGVLAVVNVLHGIFSFLLLVAAWVNPKKVYLSMGYVLFVVTLILNVTLNLTGGLLNFSNWWGLVVLAVVLSVNVFALRSVTSETHKIPQAL